MPSAANAVTLGGFAAKLIAVAIVSGGVIAIVQEVFVVVVKWVIWSIRRQIRIRRQ